MFIMIPRPLRKIKKVLGLGYRRAKDKEYESILSADYIPRPLHSLKDIVAQAVEAGPGTHPPCPPILITRARLYWTSRVAATAQHHIIPGQAGNKKRRLESFQGHSPRG